jgi:hypothetical protein
VEKMQKNRTTEEGGIVQEKRRRGEDGSQLG